jgi:hypothetical protein
MATVTPGFRIQTLYEFGAEGWSDEWYLGPGSAKGAEAAAFAWATARFAGVTAGVSILGCRITDLTKPRSGYVKTYPQFVGSLVGNGEPLLPGNAWLLRVREPNFPASRNVYLRGCGVNWVQSPVVGDVFVPSAFAIAQAQTLVACIVANNLSIRVPGKFGSAGTNSIQVNSAQVNTDGSLGLVSTAMASLTVDGKTPIIATGFKGLAARINGTYGGAQCSLLNPTTLKIGKLLSAFQTAAYQGMGGQLRNPSYQLIIPAAGQLEYLTEKKTGRAFFVPRGRRSVAK